MAVKMTLLSMVQNILSSMDSDEINSVADTVEAIQVAEVVKETYYELLNGIDMPETAELFQLTSVSDVTKPNYLQIPTTVDKVLWVKYKDYRNSDRLKDLEYLRPEDFLNMQLDRTSGFQTTDPSGLQFYIDDNKAPQYYTIFDDTYLVTDSFDSDYESVLQSTNSIAFGYRTEEFEMTDDFIPNLDANVFPLLLAEAKATCFTNFKQIANPREEKKALRQRMRLQRDKFKTTSSYKGSYANFDYSRKR